MNDSCLLEAAPPTQAWRQPPDYPQVTRNGQPQEDAEVHVHSHQRSAPHGHPPTAPPCHLPLPSSLQPRAPTQSPHSLLRTNVLGGGSQLQGTGICRSNMWERGRGAYQTPCKQGPCRHPPAGVPCPRRNKSEAATSQRLRPTGLPPLAGAQAQDGGESGARSWYLTTGPS